MAGVLISLEGIEGSGKSTQGSLLAQALRAQGCDVLVTREPGGTATGQVLRRLVLEPSAVPLASAAELLLMLADRAQHVLEIITPALQADTIVICDRFVDSTTAYQGYGRGIPLDFLADLNAFICGRCLPVLTLLLDLPVTDGLRRAGQRRGQEMADKFERESLAFHERIRAGYLELARTDPQRVRLIDATRSVEEIHRDIMAVVQERL